MVFEFSHGKIIVTPHEVVVRLQGSHSVTLNAQVDAVQLIGRGANVLVANGAECKWSIKLDSESQLVEISQQLGVAIDA
ncbi:DUF3389 domain-containing protein [Vibrio vulnificus]|uniref:DUF3389 domain-containing protein n=1 Tax=Vibrio vulnificus TaxID=672 RepID=UPI001A25976A|nr:DUF3389 domain-containing protein [Vibrio vulnificus]EID4419459.1 DUF3389 domain-containing protein [Vibrio vulnificus]ELV8610191.1 DUF3389 domain-containing protein [Vibrio vulnificus]MCG8703478.1 DUF3389 domain-containing protein [Vibrio vulnificus]MCU8135036.1 DUF3389 domain-containing protein [Vibrio vulnificus]HAS8153223.1 DUF3389 domain-containing protein [Vibrio vulnificus]